MKSMVGLKFPTYEALSEAGMPSIDLINCLMVPLPDTPINGIAAPSFAVKVNSIKGGFVVALYLHHCVGDFGTLRGIIEHISGDLSPHELLPKALEQYALEESKVRSVLCDPKSYNSELAKLVRFAHVNISQTRLLTFQFNFNTPGNLCRLFSFDIKILNEATSIINARASTEQARHRASDLFRPPKSQETAFDVLTAILWKGITRARVDRGMLAIDENEFKLQSSTVINYVDLRNTVDSSLEATYFGNAQLEVFATEPIYKLLMPIDALGIERAARAIMMSKTSAFEGRVRSTIAAINEANNVQQVAAKGMLLASDLVIMNWDDLDLKKATSNLGLGGPGWARQIGFSMDTFLGCIVHTTREDAGVWDVMVQVPLPTMQRMVNDSGFMDFVKYHA